MVHGAYVLGTDKDHTQELTPDTWEKSSFQFYAKGHEYFPMATSTLNANPNLTGNSANNNVDNSAEFLAKWSVHPVYDPGK